MKLSQAYFPSVNEIFGRFSARQKKRSSTFFNSGVSKVVTVKRSVVNNKKGAIGCFHFDRFGNSRRHHQEMDGNWPH